MKYKILLCAFYSLSSFIAFAQRVPDRAFAIVSTSTCTMEWMNIQEIDLSTGKVIRSVFDKGRTGFVLLDAITRKQVNKNPASAKARPLTGQEHPTSTMVAAAAYDKRHNRLYFTPMRLAELRWIDAGASTGSLKVYCLSGQSFSSGELNKEENHITRMAIAADGNGYALSNDGRTFIRFTTGKKPVVTQLGSLKDAPDNNGISVHERSNWGGDMIADATGNLFVFGANRSVFKINIRRQVARHLGFLEGLPDNFTTNGAAIDKNGDLILSSAISTEGFYKADLRTLKAFKPDVQSQVVSSADLATGNLAFEKSDDRMSVLPGIDYTLQKSLNIYPNPVTRGYFKINFSRYLQGQYELQLVDLSGKIISQKKVFVQDGGQTERITMNSKLARGMYLIKILDGSRKTISSGKVLLQ